FGSERKDRLRRRIPVERNNGNFKSVEAELLASKRDLMKFLDVVRKDPVLMAKVKARVEENRRKAALAN
ncbi:MAG: hypothetical protein IJL98_07390, partial [Lachnospiraceae bacterium]|nr:hypothetical protein [Lachnospiraceae bacterium]